MPKMTINSAWKSVNRRLPAMITAYFLPSQSLTYKSCIKKFLLFLDI